MTELKTYATREGFTSRWSKRKHAVRAGAQPDLVEEEQAKAIEIAKEMERNIAQEKADKLAALNALTDEDMPAVESLDESSDFSQFMSTSVSEGLRKLALRKLFHSEQFNMRDGLDEYDGDYTHFEKLDPSTITADMKHLLEVEAEKLEQMREDAVDANSELIHEQEEILENNEDFSRTYTDSQLNAESEPTDNTEMTGDAEQIGFEKKPAITGYTQP